MPELCESFSCGKPSRQGSEYRFGTHGSLAVQIAGPNAGLWFDHEAGEGGHVFEFINHHIGGSFKEAREWAINWLGGTVDYKAMKPRKRSVIAEDKNPYRDAARSIWNDAEPLQGAIGQAYLRRRAINVLPSGDVARFVPSLNGKAYIEGKPRRIIAPAIVMLVRDIETGEPMAIQRRYLSGDGTKHPLFPKAKSLGKTKGGAIMLTGFEVLSGNLNICEGFEDALSVLCLGLEGGSWAVCGTSGLKNLHPLSRVNAIRIFADNDKPGQERATECAKRWQRAGKWAVWQTLGDAKDINAYLMARTGAVSYTHLTLPTICSV